MLRTACLVSMLLVASCATPAPPAASPVVAAVFDPDAAMRDLCNRKLTGRSRMTPNWRAYCHRIGLELA